MLPHVILTLSLLGLALLLGATAYESVVMAPNFERDIPGSIEQARRFLSRVTPAHYFRVLAPLTQLLLLASAIVSWGTPPVRWSAVTALAALLVADVITYTFHYPRLAIMFKEPLTTDLERLRRATRQWAAGNLVRAVLLLAALLAVLHGLLEAAGLAHSAPGSI